MNDREIFLSALEIDNDADRHEFLCRHCEEGSPRFHRVQGMLNSHGQLSDFLSAPALQQLGAVDADLEGEGSLQAGGTDEGETVSLDPAEEALKRIRGLLQPSDRSDAVGRLGNYDVLEWIGSGAYGIVLKAFDEKLQRIVAIKVLSPEMSLTSPARKRFLREARSSARVHHENVVSIYAVEDQPIPHLVMEYVPGETLQQRLDEHGPLEVAEVLRIGKQVADGLAAAHAQGLIHRDVKPANILLDRSGFDRVGADRSGTRSGGAQHGITEQAKITDFGLARTADDASMTQSGLIAGTPLYMAPEQALGQPLDQRADLFSLGSVLYQMLSGRPPFRAPSTIAVLARVVDDEPRAITEIIAEVPEWIGEIVSRLHRKDPTQRFETAAEVSTILSGCLADLEAGRRPEGSTLAEWDFSTARSARSEPNRASTGEGAAGRLAFIHQPAFKVAAVLTLVFGLFAVAEAAEVTNVSGTIIRIVTPGQGTLIIEVEDPTASVAIDGEELTLGAEGLNELKLKPGSHGIMVRHAGKEAKQEWVHVERGGKTVFKVNRVSEERPSQHDDYALLSPFKAVRWKEKVVEVKVDDRWERLDAINGVPASELVKYCVEQYGEKWQKRFEEDLVQVLSETGNASGETVTLTLTGLEDGKRRQLQDVKMTHENREALWRSMEERRGDVSDADSASESVPIRRF